MHCLIRINGVSETTIPEKQNRLAFIDFLQGLLNLNHLERWSPQQAKQHPFITGEEFKGPFKPPHIPRKQHQVMKTPSSIPPTLPAMPEEVTSPVRAGGVYSTSSNTMALASSCQSTERYSQSFLPSSPYSSSLPTYYTNGSAFLSGTVHNGMRRIGCQEDQEQKSFVSSGQRPFYGNLTVPRVLEPTDGSNARYRNESSLKPLDYRLGSMLLPHNHRSNVARPRANTVGTMHVPPQIQRVSMDISPDASDTFAAGGSNRYNSSNNTIRRGKLLRCRSLINND